MKEQLLKVYKEDPQETINGWKLDPKHIEEDFKNIDDLLVLCNILEASTDVNKYKPPLDYLFQNHAQYLLSLIIDLAAYRKCAKWIEGLVEKNTGHFINLIITSTDLLELRNGFPTQAELLIKKQPFAASQLFKDALSYLDFIQKWPTSDEYLLDDQEAASHISFLFQAKEQLQSYLNNNRFCLGLTLIKKNPKHFASLFSTKAEFKNFVEQYQPLEQAQLFPLLENLIPATPIFPTINEDYNEKPLPSIPSNTDNEILIEQTLTNIQASKPLMQLSVSKESRPSQPFFAKSPSFYLQALGFLAITAGLSLLVLGIMISQPYLAIGGLVTGVIGFGLFQSFDPYNKDGECDNYALCCC